MTRTPEQILQVREAIEAIALAPKLVDVTHAKILRDEILRLRSDLAVVHGARSRVAYARAATLVAAGVTTAHPVDSAHGDQSKIAGLLVRDLRDLAQSLVAGEHTVAEAVRDLRHIALAYGNGKRSP